MNRLTKKHFERLLTKAAQPKRPDSKETETSTVHPSDGYNRTYVLSRDNYEELIVTDVFRFTCPKCGKESVITGLLPTEKLIDSEEGNE